jgi:hypothetical protein
VFVVSNSRWISQDSKDFVDRNFRAVELVKEWEVVQKEGHVEVVLFPEELTVVGHGESEELCDGNLEEVVDVITLLLQRWCLRIG